MVFLPCILSPYIYDNGSNKGIVPYSIKNSDSIMLLCIFSDSKDEYDLLSFLREIDLVAVEQKCMHSYPKSVSYYVDEPARNEFSRITHCIFVSTEDDKMCVKGGIGTYLGILSAQMSRYYPHLHVSWFCESPDNQEKIIQESRNFTRYYVSRHNDGYLNITEYAKLMNEKVSCHIKQLLKNDSNGLIAIESPEWEGLLCQLFMDTRSDRIIKISRLHSSLSVTSRLSSLRIEPASIEEEQVEREHEQMRHSDLISSPTSFIYTQCLDCVGDDDSVKNIRNCIVPNPVNVDDFSVEPYSRDESIEFFKQITGCDISSANFNVFAVGSVEKRKGSHLIAKFLPLISFHIPNVHLYFIGHHIKDDGDSLTSNKKLSPREIQDCIPDDLRSRVHFTGYVRHDVMPRLIMAGDVFPLCYLGDNFPGTLAEIALRKKPIIAYLKGGIPEMIRDEMENFLALTIPADVHPNDVPQKLSDAVMEFRRDNDKYVALAEKLYAHVYHKFHPRKVVYDVMRSYMSAAK